MQMTFGMSRDGAGPFLMPTIAHSITKEDPTVSIDTTGALRLMQICVDDACPTTPHQAGHLRRTGRRPG